MHGGNSSSWCSSDCCSSCSCERCKTQAQRDAETAEMLAREAAVSNASRPVQPEMSRDAAPSAAASSSSAPIIAATEQKLPWRTGLTPAPTPDAATAKAQEIAAVAAAARASAAAPLSPEQIVAMKMQKMTGPNILQQALQASGYKSASNSGNNTGADSKSSLPAANQVPGAASSSGSKDSAASAARAISPEGEAPQSKNIAGPDAEVMFVNAGAASNGSVGMIASPSPAIAIPGSSAIADTADAKAPLTNNVFTNAVIESHGAILAARKTPTDSKIIGRDPYSSSDERMSRGWAHHNASQARPRSGSAIKSIVSDTAAYDAGIDAAPVGRGNPASPVGTATGRLLPQYFSDSHAASNVTKAAAVMGDSSATVIAVASHSTSPVSRSVSLAPVPMPPLRRAAAAASSGGSGGAMTSSTAAAAYGFFSGSTMAATVANAITSAPSSSVAASTTTAITDAAVASLMPGAPTL